MKSTILTTAVFCLFACAAHAAPLLDITLWTDAPGDMPVSFNPSGVPGTGNQYHYGGSMADPDAHWDMTWDITADADPFISAGYSILNNTAMTLTFNLVTTLPIAPAVVPSSLMGGSTSGSVTDASNDGAGGASTAAGTPFYMGMIDGAGVLPIYPDPTAWNFVFAGQTVSIPAQNPGLPGPTIPGPAVNTDIGIHHTFMLSPGDRIALTSFFTVEVPEPSSMVLLALGGVALLRRRA